MTLAKKRPSIQDRQRAALAQLRHESAEAKHQQFCAVLRAQRLPVPEREHVFHPSRKWRFDYAWVAQKIALEVEGGIFTQGRHSRGAGMLKDMEKYNAAAAMGWRVLRTVPDRLTGAAVAELLRRVLRESV